MSEKESMALALAIVSWLAILLGALLIIGYLSGQHTDERIQDCIKSGRNAHECFCAFSGNTERQASCRGPW